MAPSTLALSSCTARPLTAGCLGQGLRNCESRDARERNGRCECKWQREADLGRRWRVGRQKLQFRVLCKRHERVEFRIRVKDVMHCVTRALRKHHKHEKSIGRKRAHVSSCTDGACGVRALAGISMRRGVRWSSRCSARLLRLELRFCWEGRAFGLRCE
jgi:hypothetical protein